MHVSVGVHMWVALCVCVCVCVCVLVIVREWSLAYVTHHVDGSQACSCLAFFLGITGRLVVEGLLNVEQRLVEQFCHEGRVDNTEEAPDLRTENISFISHLAQKLLKQRQNRAVLKKLLNTR